MKKEMSTRFLNIFQYDLLGESPYPNMAKIVFVLFQILIPILLLNMLIAMMGNTYASVIEKSEKEFLKQVVCFILICVYKGGGYFSQDF